MAVKRPLGSETITVVRAPLVVDPRDNSKWRNWSVATRTDIPKCMVEPFPLAEKLNYEENRDREFARSALRMYLPAGTDVVSTDRLEWNGEEYQVLGHPGRWSRFNGDEHHVAIIAQIRSG